MGLVWNQEASPGATGNDLFLLFLLITSFWVNVPELELRKQDRHKREMHGARRVTASQTESSDCLEFTYQYRIFCLGFVNTEEGQSCRSLLIEPS